MGHRIIKGLYHSTLYITGLVVLVSAVAVTIIRLALPNIGEYRSEVETWVSRYMEYPVVIHSLRANWQRWEPRLYLTGVDLLSKDGARKIIGFDTAEIAINPIKTLLERRFIPRQLIISGFQVSVARLSNGAIYMEGVSIAGPDIQANNKNELAEWLFKQDKIEIENADIEWIDVKHQQEPIQLTDVRLTIRTDDERTQVAGEAKLPGKYGAGMNFALDTTGELWSSDWSGELYISATDVSPDNWYRKYQPTKISIAGGSADLEVWSSWENASPSLVQGRLKYRDFAALSGDNAVHVKKLSCRFKGQRLQENTRDDNWHFSIKLDSLSTKNGHWPSSNLEVAALEDSEKRKYQYAVSFDYLKPNDLIPLIADLETIPGSIRRSLGTGSINGELGEGLIIYDPGAAAGEKFLYDVSFRDLAVGFGPDRPAISKLSGRLRGSTTRALLAMHGDAAGFKIPSVYDQAVFFNDISGEISGSKDARGWRLQTDELSLKTNDFYLVVNGNIEKDDAHRLPYLNLVAELDSDRLENLSRYMPYTPKFKIREWMQRALHAGYVNSAIAAIRGYPDEFPFRNNNGQLKGVINISDSVVEYSRKWPIVDNVDAEILLNNEKMTGKFRRGKVFDAQVAYGTGGIADLTKRPKVVHLDGKIKGGTNDLNRFISQSPLAQDAILEYANETLVSGDIDLNLDMSIPIKAPGMKPAIVGELNLDGAKLYAGAANLEVNDINGVVDFTQDSVAGDGLAARFAEQPVKLRLAGVRGNPDAPPTFEITGNSPAAFIVEQIAERYPGLQLTASQLGERLFGAADWQARFTFEQEAQGLSQRLDISSDLYGLAIDLPQPIRKSSYSRKELKFSKKLPGPGAMPTPVELSYDSQVGVRLSQAPDDPRKLRQLDIILGDGSDAAREPPGRETSGEGVSLSGYAEKLSLDEWWKTIKLFSPEEGSGPGGAGATGFFNSAGMDVALRVNLLEAFGQSFRETNLLADQDSEGWHIEATGEDLSGEIILPKNPTDENRVKLDLDRLVVSEVDDNNDPGDPDPKTFPPLRVEVDDFVYGNKQFGKMQLSASPAYAGLSLDGIKFEKPGLNIEGAGVWEKPGGMNKSSFNIRLQAKTFDAMLETFGYTVASMKKGKTDITIDAGWNGSPYDFSLDKLNGTFDIHIKKGRLLDVDPSAGRLFGLLSIQTLPRRLSLDFTDLLGKGLAFDEITGSFEITNGNAYTNNLNLVGPSADVLISGRTGLADQDYDQIVTVTPQFADNLPVASALLGPVGIGVGAVLYLAGNMFEAINDNIDKLLSHQYTITGSWYDPKIEKIKTPPADERASIQPAPQPVHP